MRLPPVLFAAAALAASGGFASAAQGSSFTLRNTASASVVSFQTREDGEWSDNWLASPVGAGESFRMTFNAQGGDCVLRTRVRMQGGAIHEADIDYCAAKAVVVTDQGIAGR